MTYYLLLILIAYGIMQLIVFIRANKTAGFSEVGCVADSCRDCCPRNFCRTHVGRSGIQHVFRGK